MKGSFTVSVEGCMYSHIVYTLAFKQSLYRYFGAKVCTIWAHGPLRKRPACPVFTVVVHNTSWGSFPAKLALLGFGVEGQLVQGSGA